jgi:hypothetical protein
MDIGDYFLTKAIEWFFKKVLWPLVSRPFQTPGVDKPIEFDTISDFWKAVRNGEIGEGDLVSIKNATYSCYAPIFSKLEKSLRLWQETKLRQFNEKRQELYTKLREIIGLENLPLDSITVSILFGGSTVDHNFYDRYIKYAALKGSWILSTGYIRTIPMRNKVYIAAYDPSNAHSVGWSSHHMIESAYVYDFLPILYNQKHPSRILRYLWGDVEVTGQLVQMPLEWRRNLRSLGPPYSGTIGEDEIKNAQEIMTGKRYAIEVSDYKTHKIDLVGAATKNLWFTSWVTFYIPLLNTDVCFPVNFDVIDGDSIENARKSINQIYEILKKFDAKMLFQGDQVNPFIEAPCELDIAMGYNYWRTRFPLEALYKRIYVDKIDSFKEAGKVNPQDVRARIPLNVSEEYVKKSFANVIGENFIRKDWAGEKSDLYSSHVIYEGNRISAAFLLKGPAVTRLTIDKCGKRGNQILRLVKEPATLFIVQHTGEIDSDVIEFLEICVSDLSHRKGKKLYYCTIDGVDTARILIAYDKIKNMTLERP